MRVAAAVFVAMHGLGHIIWLFSTWMQPALGKEGRAELELPPASLSCRAKEPDGTDDRCSLSGCADRFPAGGLWDLDRDSLVASSAGRIGNSLGAGSPEHLEPDNETECPGADGQRRTRRRRLNAMGRKVPRALIRALGSGARFQCIAYIGAQLRISSQSRKSPSGARNAITRAFSPKFSRLLSNFPPKT